MKKITKIILSVILIPIFCWLCWVVYDEKFCESARLSKEFNAKVEVLLNSGIKSFKLSEITDFEWDVVCVYGEEVESLGESIDLNDPKLNDYIGYNPRFFIRSNYYVPYDFIGFVFSDSGRKKITVMHRIWRYNYKSYFSDLDPLVKTKNKVLNHLKPTYLGPNECFKLIKS